MYFGALYGFPRWIDVITWVALRIPQQPESLWRFSTWLLFYIVFLGGCSIYGLGIVFALLAFGVPTLVCIYLYLRFTRGMQTVTTLLESVD